MAYRHGERRQGALFPRSIEDYVSAEAPVRVYDAIIETLGLESLGFEVDPHKLLLVLIDPLLNVARDAHVESAGLARHDVNVIGLHDVILMPIAPDPEG